MRTTKKNMKTNTKQNQIQKHVARENAVYRNLKLLKVCTTARTMSFLGFGR